MRGEGIGESGGKEEGKEWEARERKRGTGSGRRRNGEVNTDYKDYSYNCRRNGSKSVTRSLSPFPPSLPLSPNFPSMCLYPLMREGNVCTSGMRPSSSNA